MHRLFYIWDRSLCRPDRNAPREEEGEEGKKKKRGNFKVLKLLPDVWRHHACMNEFGPSNTLIVDDSISKVRFHAANAVVMSEYCVRNYAENYNEDDSLLWLLLYIEYLQSHSHSGIERCRADLVDFEQFVSEGCQVAQRDETKESDALASRAYVFFPKELVEEGERLVEAAVKATEERAQMARFTVQQQRDREKTKEGRRNRNKRKSDRDWSRRMAKSRGVDEEGRDQEAGDDDESRRENEGEEVGERENRNSYESSSVADDETHSSEVTEESKISTTVTEETQRPRSPVGSIHST